MVRGNVVSERRCLLSAADMNVMQKAHHKHRSAGSRSDPRIQNRIPGSSYSQVYLIPVSRQGAVTTNTLHTEYPVLPAYHGIPGRSSRPLPGVSKPRRLGMM